jgi:hypothetical protein
VPGTDEAKGASTNGGRTKATGDRAQPTAAPAGSPADGAKHVCDVAFCPIGLALSAVQPLKPDVVEHLLVAGREFLLAAKAVLDARVGESGDEGSPPRLERIDIG